MFPAVSRIQIWIILDAESFGRTRIRNNHRGADRVDCLGDAPGNTGPRALPGN